MIFRIRHGSDTVHLPLAEITRVVEHADGTATIHTRGGTTFTVQDAVAIVTALQHYHSGVWRERGGPSLFDAIFGKETRRGI